MFCLALLTLCATSSALVNKENWYNIQEQADTLIFQPVNEVYKINYTSSSALNLLRALICTSKG